MSENNIEIKVMQEGDTLQIRTGDLPAIKPLKDMAMVGFLTSPADYVEHRVKHITDKSHEQYLDTTKAIVAVDYQMPVVIQFIGSPKNQDGFNNVMVGVLNFSKELQSASVYWDPSTGNPIMKSKKEFLQMLRFDKKLFVVDEASSSYTKAIEALNKLDMQVITKKVDDSNQRGDKNYLLNREVKSGLPDFLYMMIPLFDGEEPIKFKVDICVEANSNADVLFWLECADIKEAVQRESKRLLDVEIERFKVLGFTINKCHGKLSEARRT